MSPTLQLVALIGGTALAAVVALCAAFARTRNDDAGCILFALAVVAGILIYAGATGATS